jgi:hypothetical protein
MPALGGDGRYFRNSVTLRAEGLWSIYDNFVPTRLVIHDDGLQVMMYWKIVVVAVLLKRHTAFRAVLDMFCTAA